MSSTDQRRYRVNLIASYTQQLCMALNGIVAPSIAIRHWGQETYGIWLLASAYMGYLYMLGGMGLDNAVFILMSRESELARKLAILRKASLVLPIVSASFILVFLASELLGFHWLLFVGNIPSGLASTSIDFGRVIMILFVVNLPLTLFGGALSGVGKYHVRSFFDALSSLLGLFGVALCAFLGKGLLEFGVYYGTMQVCLSVIRLRIVWKSLSPAKYERKIQQQYSMKAILGYGWSSFGFGCIQIVSQAFDVFVVGKLLELSLTAEYMMMLRVQGMGFSVIVGMSNALAPLIAEQQANEEAHWKEFARKIEKRVFGLACFAALFYAAWMPEFYKHWAGLDHRLPWVIILMIGCQGIVSSRNNFMHILLNSHQMIRIAMYASAIELIVKACLVTAFMNHFGVISVPLGSIISGGTASILLLQRNVSKNLKWKSGLAWDNTLTGFFMLVSGAIALTLLPGYIGFFVPIAFVVGLLAIHFASSWKILTRFGVD